MSLKMPFMQIYEELSDTFDLLDSKILIEDAVPEKTSGIVNLTDCREIISSKYNKTLDEYETNCVTTVNNQLSRVEVRVFVLRKDENGEIQFLGRPCNRGKGYTTPGGGYDLADHTPIKTAVRELYEELNIVLDNPQESSVHSFYSLPKSYWVKNYIENPADRWTGYYQYYVTAEYAGNSDNETPEEIGKFSWWPINVYEKLSDSGSKLALEVIAGHKWADPAAEKLEEAFDNEEVYGEPAKTIPGVLRYFVDKIETLNAILARERIKASKKEESDPDTKRGTQQFERRSFVSFSHQLFSHAYRSNAKWKYGVAIDQAKLETKVQALSGANIKDGFKHPGNSMYVYGAARTSDGTEYIITSFGNFAMNLSDKQRGQLNNLAKTDFYPKVETIFLKYLENMREQKRLTPTETLNAESFNYTTEPNLIKDKAGLEDNVIEGFLLLLRRPSTGMNFPELYKQVPGLWDYLQDHTALDEGELRVWLPENKSYLDISDCIVGIVLPSNYKETNYDNLQNTAPDVLYLRKLVKEKDLTIYVYQSKDTSNLPGVETVPKRNKTLEKDSIVKVFHSITASKEAAIEFIKNDLGRYKGPTATRYNNAVSSKSSVSSGLDVSGYLEYNYNAFIAAIAEYDLSAKDVANILRVGVPLQNASDTFNSIIASAESVKDFVEILAKECPNMKLELAYNKWFTTNTNAVHAGGASRLSPEEVSWGSFTAKCAKKYGFIPRDLTAMSNGSAINLERMPLKKLFKKVAKTNRKTTLACVKQMAEEYTNLYLSQAYEQYMGRHAVDSSLTYIIKDEQHNYRAWLQEIFNNFNLTKEDVTKYFENAKIQKSID